MDDPLVNETIISDSELRENAVEEKYSTFKRY